MSRYTGQKFDIRYGEDPEIESNLFRSGPQTPTPPSFGQQPPPPPSFGQQPPPQAPTPPSFGQYGQQPPPQAPTPPSFVQQPPPQAPTPPSFGQQPPPQAPTPPSFGQYGQQTQTRQPGLRTQIAQAAGKPERKAPTPRQRTPVAERGFQDVLRQRIGQRRPAISQSSQQSSSWSNQDSAWSNQTPQQGSSWSNQTPQQGSLFPSEPSAPPSSFGQNEPSQQYDENIVREIYNKVRRGEITEDEFEQSLLKQDCRI